MGDERRGESIALAPGSLWPALRERSARALRGGALQPIATEREVVEDGGVAFVVRVLTSPSAKRQARRVSPGNPFLPFDAELLVAEISDSHVGLLNKYSVVEHHLLIVTRAFEEQESPLSAEDFAALWACLAEIDGLGFYNAGAAAGASQRHKHLQLVPAPLGSGPERAPVEPLLRTARFAGDLGRVPGLPFLHALARLEACAGRPAAQAAPALLERYRALLRAVGDPERPGPYNLLVTRDWMLLVPRSREAAEGIPVNALAFAGAFLVHDRAQLARLRRRGPLRLLRAVAVARD